MFSEVYKKWRMIVEKNFKVIVWGLFIVTLFSCREKTQPVVAETIPVQTFSTEEPEKVRMEPQKSVKEVEEISQSAPASTRVKARDVKEFIPEDFVLFEEVYGDLNKDGVDDCVLIIKGTDEEYVIEHEYRGTLDRNRRGIIIALNKGDYYERVVYNLACFASENEDGGVYFAPELWLEIKRGVLLIRYSHGRYGHWWYTFRYQNNTFELIGYDSHENRGPIELSQTSINFSTGKIKTSVNVNANMDDDVPEKWEVRWDDVAEDSPLIDLNEISALEDLFF